MRVYPVYINNVSVSTAITIVQFKGGAAQVTRILRAWCSQNTLTTSAQQRIQIVRKTAAATVSAFTFTAGFDPADASNGVSATSGTGTNASAEGTDGDVLVADAFNVLNGWLWVPTPEERIIIAPSGIIGLKFPAAPGSAMTVTAGFLLGEEG